MGVVLRPAAGGGGAPPRGALRLDAGDVCRGGGPRAEGGGGGSGAQGTGAGVATGAGEGSQGGRCSGWVGAGGIKRLYVCIKVSLLVRTRARAEHRRLLKQRTQVERRDGMEGDEGLSAHLRTKQSQHTSCAQREESRSGQKKTASHDDVPD